VKRHRLISASPARGTSQTVAVITDLVTSTLRAADGIAATSVDAALLAARPALLLLVSSRHLATYPVVLVAGQTVCEILCRYDGDAIDGDENLSPVQGMSAADSFMLHLPAPDQLREPVGAAAACNAHLSTDPAPTQAPRAIAASTAPLVAADALRGLL
jgi:hypothetical protein